MPQLFIPGQRVLVVGKHPHAGTFVKLVSFGPYGLDVLNLVGWLARADDGQEFYCQLENLATLGELPAADFYGQLKKLSGLDEQPPVVEQVQLVEAVEEPASEDLGPTVSPVKRETTLDKLRAYYRAREDAPVLLTAHQLLVLKRLEAAWSLMLDAKTSEKAAKKLMENFKISKPQAYRDLADCKQLFGDVVESSRKADRYLLKEMGLEVYGKAKKAGELGEMNKALGNLIKITGIEKADPNIPDEAVFQASQYLLEMPAGAGAEKLTINLEAIAALPAHEYEQVMDYIQQSGTTDLEMLRYIQEAARGIAS